jgi:hypothetical protein
MASLFQFEQLNGRSSLFSSDAPDTIASHRCFQVCRVLASSEVTYEILTFKERCCEVYTHVAIPCALSTSLDCTWNRGGVHLFNPLQNSIRSSKSNDDFGYAEKKRLDPELHQLPLEGNHVSIVSDISAGLQFYPVDWTVVCRFNIPY